MKKNFMIWLAISLTVGPVVCKSQTMAVTEDGDTIYVYDNGTWSFEQLEEMPELANDLAFLSAEVSLDTLTQPFEVSPDAKKQVENARGQFVIKYDDKEWKRVPPATLNDAAEFAFQSKKSDIWCIVISEETSIAHDKLFLVAKNTMKQNTGSEPEIIKTELRTVNGHEVVRGVMKADFSGIPFVFDTFYFSNELGSVQFTAWTGDGVWAKNEEKILALLHGFMVQ